MPGNFLGGAQDRLLHVSIPFRFFLSAAFFHIAAWGVLLFAADQVAGFTGGPGPVLAAIHLATLGVFTMTAIGASFQLLPVVTRHALARDWPARFSFWLLFTGICLLTWGMGVINLWMMQAGAGLVSSGLLIFVVLTADNLRRAGSIAVVASHGWAALAALVVAVLLGTLLIWDFETGFLSEHGGLAIVHMVLASYGFMGLLALGLSLVLVPMFTLSRSLPHRPGWVQLALATLALISFSSAYLTGSMVLNWLALLAGTGSVASYLWLMQTALAGRMRKRLGISFILIRLSWGLLIISLILAGFSWAELGPNTFPALFGFVLLAGWLLTFLLGILQRIMPFLASMHANTKSGIPPLLSELTAELPLKIHAFCHIGTLALCAAGIVLEMNDLVRIGAGLGLIGALSFGAFAVGVVLKLKAFSTPT